MVDMNTDDDNIMRNSVSSSIAGVRVIIKGARRLRWKTDFE